jgi:polysaccharide export outer membrane protein
MKRPLGLLAALLTIASLAGCASSRSRSAQSDPASLSAAMRTVSDFKSGSYRIAPSDLLSVAVYPDQQLNAKERVDADGAISLPLIGTMTVTGATLMETQKAIERRLASYLVNPHVTLLVEEYGNRQMFVLGQVQSPGTYPVPAGARMTALQAISTAGGFTKVAAPRRTHLLRYVNGKSVDRVIDLKAVTLGKGAEADVVLEPNDIIYVPQSIF